MSKFLTYVHAKPGATTAADIFYVGKGSRKRMLDFTSNRNKHYGNIVAKHGLSRICVGFLECSTEQNALNLERGLIKLLRAANVQLVNMTDGGDGVSGWKMPEHQKLKMSRLLKGRVAPNKGKPSPLKGGTLSDEHKRKLSAAKMGSKSPRAGIKLSFETRGKISKSQQDHRWLNNGVVETKCSPSGFQNLLESGFDFGRLSTKRSQNRKES